MSPITHGLRFLERILSIGGIAGLIGLGIAASICFRYVQYGAQEIPQVLTYALTTIIGFYFGTTAGHGHQRQSGGTLSETGDSN